jgi:hypothetical protein
MKLCPSCRTTYVDDTLNFCLSDGTPLVKESPTPDPQATLILPASADESNRQTQAPNLYAQTARQPVWTTPTPQTVPASQSKRSLMPWIIGGGIFLGIVGIGLVITLALLGGRNDQSTTNNTSVTSNSSNNQNSNSSNNNQTQSSSLSSSPYAAFADRTGRYEGPAVNTTYNPPTRGTITLDIKTINADSGYVSTMLTSGGNLCGDAPLTGKLTQDGKMNLNGKLTCKAANYLYTAPMTTRCQFTATDTLTCTYTLTNPAGTKPATQHGNFKVKKR